MLLIYLSQIHRNSKVHVTGSLSGLYNIQDIINAFTCNKIINNKKIIS